LPAWDTPKAGRLDRKSGHGVYDYPEPNAAVADAHGAVKKSAVGNKT
jgi:3-hydroxyacyl-CoA dehydrogenase